MFAHMTLPRRAAAETRPARTVRIPAWAIKFAIMFIVALGAIGLMAWGFVETARALAAGA